MVKECTTIGPWLVIECCASDFVPSSREEVSGESGIGFSQTFSKNTAAVALASGKPSLTKPYWKD